MSEAVAHGYAILGEGFRFPRGSFWPSLLKTAGIGYHGVKVTA